MMQGPELLRELKRMVDELAALNQIGKALTSSLNIDEVKARGWNKGTAIRRMMESTAFAGRRPIFVGDDRTDLDGMEAARALGGGGIAVGGLEAHLAWELADPAAVRAWLKSLLD